MESEDQTERECVKGAEEGRWNDRGQGNRNDHLCSTLETRVKRGPPSLSLSLSISPQTTCWHCLVYSRNKMLIKRGWNYCTCMDKACGQGTPFISLPSSYPSSPFTLDLRDFRLHARVCVTGRRLMSPGKRVFLLPLLRVRTEQLTDRLLKGWRRFACSIAYIGGGEKILTIKVEGKVVSMKLNSNNLSLEAILHRGF